MYLSFDPANLTSRICSREIIKNVHKSLATVILMTAFLLRIKMAEAI